MVLRFLMWMKFATLNSMKLIKGKRFIYIKGDLFHTKQGQNTNEEKCWLLKFLLKIY